MTRPMTPRRAKGPPASTRRRVLPPSCCGRNRPTDRLRHRPGPTSQYTRDLMRKSSGRQQQSKVRSETFVCWGGVARLRWWPLKLLVARWGEYTYYRYEYLLCSYETTMGRLSMALLGEAQLIYFDLRSHLWMRV